MFICLLPVEEAGSVNYHEIEIDINVGEVIVSYYRLQLFKWSPDSKKITLFTPNYLGIVDENGEIIKIEGIDFFEIEEVIWINNEKIIIPRYPDSFEVYDIYSNTSKIYSIIDDENKDIIYSGFYYDFNHNKIAFAGCITDSSHDIYFFELFILDLNTGIADKIVETEAFDFGISRVFFNRTGDKVFYFIKSRYSALELKQLNVYDIERKENKIISEVAEIEEVNKEENLAYGYKLYLTDEDLGKSTSFRKIVVDMEKDTIEPYDIKKDEVLNIAGCYVPSEMGYIDKEDVLIYLSPDRKKALYLKYDECIKLLISDN